MFETTTHDFGSVARGAKAEFEFRLKNTYVEDVHIASVRSSCGCTTPRIQKQTLKTYEQGAILAHLNTPTFTGRKGATLTVTIDRPFPATVQLHVRSHIHGDVVFEPGSVQLGAVDQGTEVVKTIRVRCPAQSDWRITGVKSANDHLSARLFASRDPLGGVSYQLQVRLDANAPTGYIQDRLMLVTSDLRGGGIAVLVEGRVLPAITVSPAPLFMGVLEPGQQVSKKLVVRGNRPFRITQVSAAGEGFRFETSSEQAAKPFHLIPVTFVAGNDLGRVVRTIRIQTDLDNAVAELSASALVSRQRSDLTASTR
ncbi:MAG: hypothetical protein A2V70_09565 [Planctomycetes bacterium RBG_13_63_9]|nr:MAG: hypothetical protein A2V70_09565 [Planctomycetes bacterium RBG_13_63_9]